jgi:hypothetical protein
MATKKLEKYFVPTTGYPTSLDEYMKCPTEAFLLYVCDAYDAFHNCENKFTKRLIAITIRIAKTVYA